MDNPKVVKQIYELYLDGVSIYKISRILKDSKFLTPRADVYRSNGSYGSIHIKNHPYEWSPRTIMNILLNEVYIGNIICNRNQTKTFKSKQLKSNPMSEWIISENKHESIIDKETFSKVQEIIKKSKRLPKNTEIDLSEWEWLKG